MDTKIRPLFVGKKSKVVEKDVNVGFWAIRVLAKNDGIPNGIVSANCRALADVHETDLDVTIRSTETSDISFWAPKMYGMAHEKKLT